MATASHQAASPVDRHASPIADTGDRSGKATASLIFGILGLAGILFAIVGVLFAGIALALGLTARSEIKQKGLGGMGLANVGLTLGIIGLVLNIASMVLGAIIAF